MPTAATSMAGRGTDIKLGAGVAELGGLVVIGTERMESHVLTCKSAVGRSGRQGDPGMSKFLRLTFEDDGQNTVHLGFTVLTKNKRRITLSLRN